MRQKITAAAVLVLAALTAATYLIPPAAYAPPLQFVTVPCLSTVTVATNTESVLATTPGLNLSAGLAARLLGVAALSASAGTTSIAFRLRRGTTTAGVLVGSILTSTMTSTGGAMYVIGAEDSPGEVAAQQYSFTALQNNATVSSSAGVVTGCELLLWGW